MKKPRILILVTHPMTLYYLMNGQLRYLSDQGFEVHAASGPGRELADAAGREGVAVHSVPMQREINPLADLRSLWAIFRLIRRLKPDIVNAGTPKAGLLGMTAARLAGVPVRIYTLRGLRMETCKGLKYHILRLSEKLAMRCAGRVICVSESLRRRCRELRLVSSDKLRVLGAGSSNGVDDRYFLKYQHINFQRAEERKKINIPPDAFVVGFVGRFTRDKGIADAVKAFDRISLKAPESRLLLLGDFEKGDPAPDWAAKRIKHDRRIIHAGFVRDTAPYYPVMDILVFPSYREGFPNAPLEAAAAGVPVAGYRSTGTVDAVAHGETGLLAPAGDAAALARIVEQYLADEGLRSVHGAAGRRRAEKWFRSEIVRQRWAEEYRRLWEENNYKNG